jgi:hypothetical protein
MASKLIWLCIFNNLGNNGYRQDHFEMFLLLYDIIQLLCLYNLLQRITIQLYCLQGGIKCQCPKLPSHKSSVLMNTSI